ncbi:MAG: FAD:protein FMN transferase [Bacteroidaceae bacterium]|nr:FAD:protein FMN transferase [Bacteroidaceae bacterium]
MRQNKWGWRLPFLLFLCVATVFVIRRHAPEGSLARPVDYQRSEGTIFGTVWHATYQSDSSLQHSILQELRRVDASLSMFNPKSTLSRINRGETAEMDSLLRIVLTQAMQVSRETEGCFDVTVAPLVNAWGFGFKHDVLPDSAQVDSLRQFVGWQGLTIEKDRLTKADERMVIDLSAIAKGFGVDQVASLFNRHGIRNYMIEIGGEIVVKGKNPKGEAWNIGVNKPVEDSTSLNQEILTTLHLTDCAMATSGNYRNYYISPDGRKLAHTIDPHTGYPVRHSLLSSTVVAPVCSMADAFATSFMVMGLERARELLGRHPELKAYLIYSDDKGELKVWENLENDNEKNGK